MQLTKTKNSIYEHANTGIAAKNIYTGSNGVNEVMVKPRSDVSEYTTLRSKNIPR